MNTGYLFWSSLNNHIRTAPIPYGVKGILPENKNLANTNVSVVKNGPSNSQIQTF
jgi:hypothetical protein